MTLSAYIPQKANIQAYYKLENVNDDSANARTLTNTGTVSFAGAGKVGNCADFGNANSSKSLSIASNMGVTGGNISISCWVNPYATTQAGDHPIIILCYDNIGVAYGLSQGGSGIQAIRLRPAVTWGGTTAESVTASAWSHWGMIYNTSGTLLSLIKNGVVVQTASQSGTGGTGYSDLTIMGNGFGGGGVYWNGQIDEVIIWNTVLSDSDMLRAYKLTAPAVTSPGVSDIKIF